VNAPANVQDAIIEDMARFYHDPLGFVMYTFPWGEKGTELEKEKGPRKWQKAFLERVSKQLKKNKTSLSRVIREACASGHGIGKSALIAWLVLWALSTREDTRGIITAGTEPQLETKTWPELAKWHRLSINADWFEFTATCIFSKDPAHSNEWRMDRVTWNKARPEAFAGLHNAGKRLLVIFDEASQIDDTIWDVKIGRAHV
jgi:hypothetical protein